MPPTAHRQTSAAGIDLATGRAFWSFQPPQSRSAPAVKDAAWANSDIDRFILAKLDEKGMKPATDADPRTLIRRVSIDLTGLPPTPEDVEAFAKDPSSAAFEKVVDKLLASPRYGERWGRHWLDLARYAAQTARTRTSLSTKPTCTATTSSRFNQDKPFNRFIREQVAGDLLEAKSQARPRRTPDRDRVPRHRTQGVGRARQAEAAHGCGG